MTTSPTDRPTTTHLAIGARLDVPERTAVRRWTIVVVAWGAGVALLSTTGALSALPLLALAPVIGAGIVVPLAVVLRSPVQRRLVARVDLAHLTWFNVWRVPAALAFFAVGAQGLLPQRFVTNAGWGDLAAGIAAPLVVIGATRLRHRSRARAYLVFHLFSFGDFVVAVGTGLTFTVLGDPLMRTLLDTPMALIPLWGVPTTGAISLLALHRLLLTRRWASPIRVPDDQHHGGSDDDGGGWGCPCTAVTRADAEAERAAVAFPEGHRRHGPGRGRFGHAGRRSTAPASTASDA
jgi:hypothetical protein